MEDLGFIVPVVLAIVGILGMLARFMGAKHQGKAIREQHEEDRENYRRATETWSSAIDKQTTLRISDEEAGIDDARAAVDAPDATDRAAEMWG